MIAITLGLVGIACAVGGAILDDCEWRYGWPRRLPLRWEFLGVCVGCLFLIAAVVVALVQHA